MQFVRAGARDRIEKRADGIPKFRSESVVHGLHLLNPCLGDREQANAGAVALNIVASIDLVVDSAVEAVGIQLPRYTELGVCATAYIGLLKDEVEGVARNQRQI